VLLVHSLPQAAGAQQQPARGGRPKLYPVCTRVRRGSGTLTPGTQVRPRAGTVFPSSDSPPRLTCGGVLPPCCGASGGAPESDSPSRRRGACLFCGHLGHWVWECPAQSSEVRARGHAQLQAVAAHRSGRGPAPLAPLPLGMGPPDALPPPSVATTGSGPPGTAAIVHAVNMDDQVYPEAAGAEGKSFSEE